MNSDTSPEEKLLNLIRGKKKAPQGGLPSLSPNPRAANKKRFSLSALPNFNYSFAKKLLPLFFVMSVIYLVFSFIYPFVGLRNIKLPDITKVDPEGQDQTPKEEVLPYEFYSQDLAARELFSSPSIQGGEIPSIAAETDSIKDINLVGIISGDSPQAIIENKKSQKTFYVSKGQFIGDFLVEDIQEGKIIINFKGQRYELNI